MKITEKTLFNELFVFDGCLTDESEKELLTAAKKSLKDYYNLTFAEFFACSRGDFSCIGIDTEHPEQVTALQGVWVKGFSAFVDEFITAMERLNVPPTAEMQQAAVRCIKVKFEESVVVFIREYFGLSSFAAAYDVKLTEYIIARRDTYNKQIVERAFADIQQKKYKK